jgi:hypothetical protein
MFLHYEHFLKISEGSDKKIIIVTNGLTLRPRYGGLAAPFSPSETSYMATTMVTTYQHIEAQGRATHRAGLAWGGGVGPLPCKWGEEREEEPLPRRIIKSGISCC